MTLNNLANHLPWLLSHVDLSNPVGPVLPSIHDTAFDTSRSFTSTAVSSQRPAAARQPTNNNNNLAPRPPYASSSSRGPPTTVSQHPRPDDIDPATIDDDDPFADEEEELAGRFADEEDIPPTRNTRGTTTAMGRLTTKSAKKPSLVSKQEQLNTPPTPAVGKLQQAYTASLSNKNGSAKLQQAYSASLSSRNTATPAKKTASPSMSRVPSWISKPQGPARREATPQMPEDDEDMLDLTAVGDTADPDATGDTTWAFGSPVQVWNESAAWRAEPPPSRGRKRKSSEMVESSPRPEPKPKGKGKAKEEPKQEQELKEEDEDEFPDVFDLVDEDLKTPAMIERRKAVFSSVNRRSPVKGSPPKLHISASDTTFTTQRTITHTRSTTETTIHRTASMDRTPCRSSSATSMAESPSGRGKEAMLPPPEPSKRTKTSSPAKTRRRPRSASPMPLDEDYMSDGGILDQPKSSSPQPSRPAGRFDRSDVIMDSDDDDDDFDEIFETPPTREVSGNASCVTAGTGGTRSGSQLIHTSSRETEAEPDRPAIVAPAKSPPVVINIDSSELIGEDIAFPVDGMQASDTDKQRQPAVESAREYRSSGSTNDGTLIMDLFKQQPHALDILEKPIQEKITQNTADLVRALREKWPAERRHQIKQAKPPLIKQKDAFVSAKTAHKAFCELDVRREELLAEITTAYDADQDTEVAEARLEDLEKEIEESEQVLKQALVAAGITVESFNDLPDLPSQQPATVMQPTGATRSLSRASSFIPECASQNIPQSQSGSRPPSRSRPVSSEQPAAASRPPVPPFHREEMQPLRPPHSNRTSVKPPTLGSVDDQGMEDFFGDDDDFFAQPPDIFQPRSTAAPPPRASSSTRPGPRSPIKPRPRLQDNFSDYGSDEDDVAAMVAMAEVTEVEEGNLLSDSRSNRPRARSVFSEASGNSGPPSRLKSLAKKPVQLVPKLKPPPELMQHPWSRDMLKAFKDMFRLQGFRPNQLEAINATLEGQDAFVLMPTGGGKSLCYQLPAVITSGKTQGVTIVVTPLLSLMQDQVDHLRALNIRAKAFSGDVDRVEKQDILESFKLRNPELHVQLLYVTPEMINKSAAFLNGLHTLHKNKKFARLVIDEAHCVSQWGHDFRPDYKDLGQVRQQFPGVPIIALTATATHNVIMDVKHNLSMENCKVFSQSFNRANLYYDVRMKEKQCVNTIAKLISEKYAGKTGIVYTLSRKSTEQIAQKLCDQGIKAKHYHAAMAAAEKTQVQRDWQSGRVKVVVATIAFGMGIDKPDVRFVVHQYLPKSLEGYYQETGRAGRDGLPSDCYLFFSHGDIFQLRKFIEDSDGNQAQRDRQKEMLNRVVMFCENTRDCRRTQLLHYFGETFHNSKCGKNCDNCRNSFPHETEDRTDIAKAILEAVMHYNRLTMIQCTDAIQGKKKDKDEETQPFHGVGKGLQKYEIFRIINSLAAEHALGEENRVGGGGIAIQYFIMGKNASLFLRGGKKLSMVVQRGGDKNAPAKATKKKTTKKTSTAYPASTCISSPVRAGARTSKKAKAVAAKFFDVEAIAEDDEVDNEDCDPHVARHANGYEKDDFVVDDDDDGYFEPAPPPPKQRRQRTLDELAPQASAVPVAQPDEIQNLILEEFMRDATKLEEELRNNNNIRTPLFTEVQLQQMLIRWTNTTAKMGRIPGIKDLNVLKFGAKLIPLVNRYHETYQDMCGGQDESMATIPATAGPARNRRAPPTQHEVVDLLSDEDEDEEVEAGERSQYFGAGNADDPIQRQLQESERRLEETSRHINDPVSRGRSNTAYGNNGGKKGGGKKFYKKGGGGSRAASKSYSGVSKRKGSTGAGRRTSGGSAKSGATSRSAASTVKRTGGGGGSGGSGIGIMPF